MGVGLYGRDHNFGDGDGVRGRIDRPAAGSTSGDGCGGRFGTVLSGDGQCAKRDRFDRDGAGIAVFRSGADDSYFGGRHGAVVRRDARQGPVGRIDGIRTGPSHPAHRVRRLAGAGRLAQALACRRRPGPAGDAGDPAAFAGRTYAAIAGCRYASRRHGRAPLDARQHAAALAVLGAYPAAVWGRPRSARRCSFTRCT